VSGLKKDNILMALYQLENRFGDSPQLVHDYKAPFLSEKVVNIIISYCEYVNRTVWYYNL